MFNNKNFQRVLLLIQPNLIGYASSFITNCISKMSDYGNSEMFRRVVAKTSLAPPSWVFFPVWVTLYTLIGIAAFRVFSLKESTNKRKGMMWNQINLFFNFTWTIVYFGLKMVPLAFANILLIWGTIIITMYYYKKIDTISFALMVPYLAWVTFASYLNFLAV